MAYLHGARGSGLMFGRGSELDLTLCSNTANTDKSNDRRSVSGTVVALSGPAVGWASSCVTLSTT